MTGVGCWFGRERTALGAVLLVVSSAESARVRNEVSLVVDVFACESQNLSLLLCNRAASSSQIILHALDAYILEFVRVTFVFLLAFAVAAGGFPAWPGPSCSRWGC